jgi:hypothetical protein
MHDPFHTLDAEAMEQQVLVIKFKSSRYSKRASMYKCGVIR